MVSSIIIRGVSTLSFFKTKILTKYTIKNYELQNFSCWFFAFVVFLVTNICVFFVLRKESVLTPLIITLLPLSIHWYYISLSWSFIGLFHDMSAAWICPVSPPGMTTGLVFSLLSNFFTLWTRWALKLSHENNPLLPKVKVF